ERVLLPGRNRVASRAATGGFDARTMEHIRSIGPGRILVIGRDPAVSRFVEFVLGNWEAFDVTSISEPALALARIETEPWDLVLVDYELPSSDGQDAMRLLASIREIEPP